MKLKDTHLCGYCLGTGVLAYEEYTRQCWICKGSGEVTTEFVGDPNELLKEIL